MHNIMSLFLLFAFVFLVVSNIKLLVPLLHNLLFFPYYITVVLLALYMIAKNQQSLTKVGLLRKV